MIYTSRFPKIKTKRLSIYHYTQSPSEMVKVGRRNGESFLTIARQLQLEAIRLRNDSPLKSKKYDEGASLAFRLYRGEK